VRSALLVAGTWLYEQCVTFVIHLADLLDVTYRDANALLFFVVWPLVTAALVAWVAWNAVVLHRESRRSGERRERGAC
jgi:hypothetical protein